MGKPPFQFRLKTVFAATAGTAALLAVVHFFSPTMLALVGLLFSISGSMLAYGMFADRA